MRCYNERFSRRNRGMVFNTQLRYYNEMNWNIVGDHINNKSSGLYKV